ncbi:hypothetical protein ACFVT2_08740 [Streptomyces sp. NPDC058000]|uniref:hypothetical protein n=1 Tax=Streptomyces sp. NPDC058000 TaxID=3346299 RepID=UPI0036E14B49
MRSLAKPAALTGPKTDRVHPRVHLALHDGVERLYLLDDPEDYPASTRRNAVYDPYVHLAYILARQGHEAPWIAGFADLPLPAAHHITATALAHP